ncbi:MAG: type II toxin-antitoxin system VapC family toxin [Pseudomonadota bacterium]
MSASGADPRHAAMLDTDTCIYAINRRPNLTLRTPLHRCCVSSVVRGELEYGLLNSERRPTTRANLERFLGSLSIRDVTETVAVAYAHIRFALRAQPIGPTDLWIAAHAIALDLPLVTNNTREFARVPDLRVENWLG